MITRFRASQAARDKGFTLIELLVVIIIIGILSGVAIPLFLNQQKKARDASVKSDLRNAATAAQTYFTDALMFPTTAVGFSSNGAAPIVSDGNTYKAFVDVRDDNAGYVIYGLNADSETLYMLSSYNGGKPKRIEGVHALPVSVHPASVTGAPTPVELGVIVHWQ